MTGVFSAAESLCYWPNPKGFLNGSPFVLLLLARPQRPSPYFRFFFLTSSPVNGSMYSIFVNCFATISSCIWFRIYSSITFLFLPTVSTYPVHQNFRYPYLYFKFAWRLNIIKLLFPFKYPTNVDTLIFGGMLTKIWIWSLHAVASIISTPSLSNKVRSISPIFFDFSIYDLPSVLRRKYDVILTLPCCVC